MLRRVFIFYFLLLAVATLYSDTQSSRLLSQILCCYQSLVWLDCILAPYSNGRPIDHFLQQMADVELLVCRRATHAYPSEPIRRNPKLRTRTYDLQYSLSCSLAMTDFALVKSICLLTFNPYFILDLDLDLAITITSLLS